MTDSRTLLADYAHKGSEAAFRELVNRYLDLVYSAAVRLTGGDTHQAEDVAQIVFADLARVARRLSAEVMLGGWLHRRTCHVAATIMRGKRRRETRERQAADMNALPDHSEASFARIAPALDEAINQLSAADRMAILLRFFEHKDFRAIGCALGSNEDAAQKRVSRALEKLHSHLKHHGVSLSATAVAAVLADQVVTAAPTGLAIAISSAALASAAGGSGTTLTLFKLITMSKLKFGIISVIVAAIVATPLINQYQALAKLREENAALRRKADENDQLAAENQTLSQELAEAKTSGPLADGRLFELMRLRREIETLRGQKHDLAQERNSSATAGNSSSPPGDSSPVPSRPETQLQRILDAPTVPLVAASSWTNAGTASPEAAWQTFRWAVSNTNIDGLAQTMAWGPDVETKAQAVFDSASPSARQQFGSVNGALYALMSSTMGAVSYGVVSQDLAGDDGTLIVQEQNMGGQVQQNLIQMHLFSDGWRAVIPSQMVGGLANYLNNPAQWPPPSH
jgi:RNA polymerase sigma factor (sigma-70 family)